MTGKPSAPISLRVPPEHLVAWRAEAVASGLSLTAWILKTVADSEPVDGFRSASWLPPFFHSGNFKTVFELDALARLENRSGTLKVVEFGIHRCEFALAAAASGCQVVLIDPMPGAKERVARQAKPVDASRITVINAPPLVGVEQLAQRGELFDFVFAQDTLQFLRTDQRVQLYQKTRELLKSSGSFFQVHQSVDNPLIGRARPHGPSRYFCDDGCLRSFGTTQYSLREMTRAGFAESETDVDIFAIRGYEAEGEFSGLLRMISQPS